MVMRRVSCLMKGLMKCNCSLGRSLSRLLQPLNGWT